MTILLLMTVLTALLVAFALYSLGSEDRVLARQEATRNMRRSLRDTGRAHGQPAIGD